MNYSYKFCVALVLISVFIAGFAFPSEAKISSEPLKRQLYLNDTSIDSLVYKINDYQLVQATFFQAMGAKVNWLNDSSTVEVLYEDIVLHYPIEKSYVQKKKGNEEWQRLDIPSVNPFIVNSKSYIPLAFTIKLLDKQIFYNSSNKSTSIYSSDESEELYWLYRIIEAEAGGESYEGKAAVAATVLNRVEHKDWPNSIKETIFQVVKVNGVSYYQFEPVYNNYIYEVVPSLDTIKAAHDALSGYDPTNGAVVFYNPKNTTNKWIFSRPVSIVIGGHVFAY